MEALKMLSIVLVLLHVVGAAVIPCSWTQFRLRSLNAESIRLLEKMGDVMPLTCLEEGERAFPDDVFLNAQQNEDLAVVALETLRGVDRIFKNDQTSVTWDREKLGLFKNIVSSRQVENLQKCVGEEASQSAVDSPSADSSIGELKSYFEELEETLRVKGFSECAWEMVRDEVLQSLKKFQAFLESRKIRMAFQCLSWISALLCIVQVCSMPTKCQLQRTLVARTHNLLETMTGPFPVQCLEDRVELRSPTWALQSNSSKQVVGVAKVVYKTLEKVSSLMENDGCPQSWDADKLEEFQSIVDRQVEESKCSVKRRGRLFVQILSIKTQEGEDDAPARDAALTDYFEKLETLLKEKEFSVCGWEVVRMELLEVLQFILAEKPNHIW
ncbi:hypothetical protein NFI96_028246 [Prochilodus magdalenae]|nr:hypothetical protein NFI96_028246 [Prochilodus magdalenae]